MSDSKEQKIKILKLKKETIIRNISNFEDFIESFEIENGNPMEIQLRLAMLMSSFTTLDQIEDELCLIDENETDVGGRLVLQNRYFSVTTKAQSILKSTENNTETLRNSSLSFSSQNGSNILQEDKFKVERVPIPTFSGRHDEWLSFKNKFNSLVDSRNYSKVDKLSYLQAALKDEALRKIDFLETSEDNYDEAWEILKSAYENEKIIKTQHINKILNLPDLKTEDHKSLNKLADISMQCYKSLSSLGLKIPSDLLVCIIERKLDPNTKQLWEEHSSHDKFENLDTLIKFIYRTATRLSYKVHNNSHGQKRNAPNQNGPPNKFRRSNSESRQVLVTTNKNCCACKGDIHPLYKCKNFLDMKGFERFKLVRENKLCFNCLKRHPTGSCRFGECKICNKKHHTLLHKGKSQEVNSETTEKASD